MLEPDEERWATYIEENEREELSEFIQGYPGDKQRVVVDWRRLANTHPELAEKVIQAPAQMQEKAGHAIQYCDVPHGDVLENARVRFKNVDGQTRGVSGLRTSDTGKLVVVSGQVSRVSEVRPRTESAAFECQRCGVLTHVPVYGDSLQAPNECDGCERKGPFVLNDGQTEYRDHQLVELQPRADEDAMNLERSIPAHLYDDLVESCQTGERVKVTGILKTDPVEAGKTTDARRPIQLQAHHVECEQRDFDSYDTDRVDEIEALAARDDLREALIGSFAPNILTGERGELHKLACILQLFGGVRHDLPDGNTVRGDVNVLLIGAPGTGKSAYLSAAYQLAPKAVKASGKGATAAGLTATAVNSDFSDGWTLDAGALVMGSGGIACIDEFDKMADSARQSMHEAMENQEVSIAKAGINTTLTTQTAVLAAANPKGGSFNRFDNVADQINLDGPLVSRFDLIYGLTDTPNESRDRQIAEHQIAVTQDGGVDPEIGAELLRQYIAYARQNVTPAFDNQEAIDLLTDKYVSTRQANGKDDDAAVPVTARMNEALRRLAEAAARSELSEVVMPRHAETAIELYESTLGDTGLDDNGDLNAMKQEGRTTTQEDKKSMVRGVIKDNPGIDMDGIASKVGMDREAVEYHVQAFKDTGRVYEPQTGEFRWT
jgi:replicative DNA helicase Mcm